MVIGVLTDIRFIEVIMKQNEILGSEICEAIKLLTSHGYAVRSGDCEQFVCEFESPSNWWQINPRFDDYEFEVSVYIDGRLTPTGDYGIRKGINKLYIYFQRPFTGEILVKERL